MDSLTPAEEALLQNFAKELSKDGMPVDLVYTRPPSASVNVKCNKPGANRAGRDLMLSAFPTFGQLKTAIKKAAGLV